MSMQTFPWWDALSISAKWGLREESREACAERLGRTLEALEPLHEGFPLLMWTGGRMRSLYPLPRRFEELAQLFEPQRIYDAARKRRLSDGYSFSADARWNGKRFITLRIGAGAHVDCDEQRGWPNSVSIATVIHDPQGEDRAIVEAMKPALLAVVAAWQPDRAAVFSHNFAAPAHDPARLSFYNGAWLIYLTPSEARTVTAPHGAAIAPLRDGGGLVLIRDGYDANPPWQQLEAVIEGLTAATAS